MQTLERLAAPDLAAAMVAYRDVLRAHQDAINRLNVYPVPDGDTGTNMALTLASVVEELEARPDADLPTLARALGHGSLMGARGNSGVILSQILRGLAEACEGQGGVDAAVLRDGLRRAADGAYRAVERPVEGTMLTVARAAADGGAAADGDGLVEVLEAARAAAADALARTPELLPVLAAAGVVDSGGSGLLLLFDALLHVTDGRPLPAAPEPDAGPGPGLRRGADPRAGGQDQAGPRYEVMYLLDAPDESIASLRAVWADLGSSIVVVGGGGVWNCHVHTDDIGGAIEAGLDIGRPHEIRVSDLWEQVEEERWVREAAAQAVELPAAEPVHCAVVAVCSGEGIRRIFHSLGVGQFVTGGQSMNPSTAELLEAIEAAPGEEVVILPNNKNVVPVAEQAAARATKPARVVATRGIQEGFAALLDYDPESDADGNAARMMASAGHVVAGEVTRAVRATTSEAGPIEVGDYLGLSRRGIEAVAPDLLGAAAGLLDRLIDMEHHEIVTVIAGEGVGAGETRQLTDWLAARHPGVGTEVHHGGQPLYPYLFSIE